MTTPARCSFCDKSQDAVAVLVASPTVPRVYICDECIALCQSILEMDEAKGGRANLGDRSQGVDRGPGSDQA